LRKYKSYVDIRGGSSGRGHQMTAGLKTTAILDRNVLRNVKLCYTAVC